MIVKQDRMVLLFFLPFFVRVYAYICFESVIILFKL